MALLNASLNLLAIKDAAKQSLADLLQTIPHKKKTMVLDSKLQGPLMMVADKKMLAENGVEKTIVLQPGMLESETKDVVYIVRLATQIAQPYSVHFLPLHRPDAIGSSLTRGDSHDRGARQAFEKEELATRCMPSSPAANIRFVMRDLNI